MIVAFRETQAQMRPVYAGPIPSLAHRVGMACVPAKREAFRFSKGESNSC